jgi:hypothetical protein
MRTTLLKKKVGSDHTHPRKIQIRRRVDLNKHDKVAKILPWWWATATIRDVTRA